MLTAPPDKLGTRCSMNTTRVWMCTYAQCGFSADDFKISSAKLA